MSQEEQPCEHHKWTNVWPTRPELQQGEERCSGCALPRSTHKFRLTALKLVNRVNRFIKFCKLGAPEIIIEAERLLIEKACTEMPTSAEVRARHKKIDEEVAANRNIIMPDQESAGGTKTH